MRLSAAAAREDEGMTLLELMAITLIIMILTAAAIATYVASTGSANAASCAENRKVLASAIVIAQSTMGDELDEIGDLAPLVKNFDSASVCPADGTPLLYNATTFEVTCPNHSD